MMPPKATSNKTNVRLAHVKACCQIFLCKLSGCVKSFDLRDLGFGQFAGAVHRAAQVIISALLVHVPGVIKLGPKKEMFRVNAIRDITLMKDAHVSWYFAVCLFPNKSMGNDGFSVNPEFAMTKMGLTSSPVPTSFSFINFAHEAIHGRFLTGSLA